MIKTAQHGVKQTVGIRAQFWRFLRPDRILTGRVPGPALRCLHLPLGRYCSVNARFLLAKIGFASMEKNSNLPKFHSLITFFWSFCFLAVGLGITAFLLFNGVKLMNGDNPYRTVLHINMGFRGYDFREIDRQPFPYLLTMVLISSIIGALWTTFLTPKPIKSFVAQILVIPWVSLIVTSPIWGIIWSVNLRSPQYFVEHYSSDPKGVMWLFYRTDAISGLTSGWFSAIQSFPINVLSYVAFCLLLFASKKLFSNVVSKKAMLPLNEKPA